MRTERVFLTLWCSRNACCVEGGEKVENEHVDSHMIDKRRCILWPTTKHHTSAATTRPMAMPALGYCTVQYTVVQSLSSMIMATRIGHHGKIMCTTITE
jgi:hypothetical protein